MVLGASPKPHRYSNQAVRLLLEYGHAVIPVHPKVKQIEGLAVTDQLSSIDPPVDTLTLYVGPARSHPLIDAIIALKPNRVILNPGTESDELEQCLSENAIPCVKDCTLVMLRSGRF